MAIYAPIDRENYPQELTLKVMEITLLEKALRAHNGKYQMALERRLLGSHWDPEYRYIVLKWEPQYLNKQWQHEMGRQRTVLLETTDPDQMIATLKMLLSVEREPR